MPIWAPKLCEKETALLEVLGETYLDTFLCSGYSYLGLCYLRQANFLKGFLHMSNTKTANIHLNSKGFQKVCLSVSAEGHCHINLRL